MLLIAAVISTFNMHIFLEALNSKLSLIHACPNVVITQVITPETDCSPSGVSFLLTVDRSVQFKNAEEPKTFLLQDKKTEI